MVDDLWDVYNGSVFTVVGLGFVRRAWHPGISSLFPSVPSIVLRFWKSDGNNTPLFIFSYMNDHYRTWKYLFLLPR